MVVFQMCTQYSHMASDLANVQATKQTANSIPKNVIMRPLNYWLYGWLHCLDGKFIFPLTFPVCLKNFVINFTAYISEFIVSEW